VLRSSLIGAIKKMSHSLGYHFHRWPSDHHLFVEYPVRAQYRYGYGKPVHRQINAILEDRRGDFEQVLREMATLKPLFDEIHYEPPVGSPAEPFWNSGWLGPRDAAGIMHFMIKNRPTKYIEIGSGMSTKFARKAIRHASLGTTITSIDPEPRAEINEICDKVIRLILQDVDLAIFDGLEPGDILSFDGSHILFTDSDVAVFFLDVLPRVKPGVLVHVHDIFWPLDYPPSWRERYYAEQYMLGMMLLIGLPKMKIKLANAFVDYDPQLRRLATPMLPSDPTKLTQLSPGIQGPGLWASSFWFEVAQPITG
jgi:hypothetical protein